MALIVVGVGGFRRTVGCRMSLGCVPSEQAFIPITPHGRFFPRRFSFLRPRAGAHVA